MPHPLEIGFACRRWGTLPAAGGWLDQPAKLFTQADYALRIYDMLAEYERMRKIGGADFIKWQKENKGVVQLVASIKE